MLGKRTFTASAVFLLTGLATFGADGDFFPLMVGNSWVYRTAQSSRIQDVQTVEVTGLTTVQTQTYYTVRFFGRNLLLRQNDQGAILVYDDTNKTEKTWLDLTGKVGSTFPSAIDNCTKSGKIVEENARYKGPAGDFSNALKLSFELSCADAGVTDAVLVPYTGFAQITWTSIIGPKTYDLVYSRTGVTELSDKQMSFGIALDQNVYTAGATMMARLTLRSTQPDPVTLNFPSGQDADLAIRNEKGDVVYRWSADKIFTMIYRTEKFGPGEKNVVLTAPLTNLAAGKYTVEGYLATDPRVYVATVPFELRGAQ